MSLEHLFGVVFFWIFFYTQNAANPCTLPLVAGTWLSSTRGTWTVSTASSGNPAVLNFKASLTAQASVANLECISSSGSLYLMSTPLMLFGMSITVYTCLDIRPTSNAPYSYLYFTVTPLDPTTHERFTTVQDAACSGTGYDIAVDTHVVMFSGAEDSANVQCPNIILGLFSFTYNTTTTSVAGNSLDSCNDTGLMDFINADNSVNLAFTTGNQLRCLYSVEENDMFYVHTYNNDTTVDNSNTYRFACWVFADSGTDVIGTVANEECQSSQTASSVASPGQTFTLTPFHTCRCNEGWYGLNCSSECGHCSDVSQCDEADGTCKTGCTGCPESKVEMSSDEFNPVTAIIVGVAIAVTVVIAAVIIGVIISRRPQIPKHAENPTELVHVQAHTEPSNVNQHEGESLPQPTGPYTGLDHTKEADGGYTGIGHHDDIETFIYDDVHYEIVALKRQLEEVELNTEEPEKEILRTMLLKKIQEAEDKLKGSHEEIPVD